jgi:hypothetical protein
MNLEAAEHRLKQPPRFVWHSRDISGDEVEYAEPPRANTDGTVSFAGRARNYLDAPTGEDEHQRAASGRKKRLPLLR